MLAGTSVTIQGPSGSLEAIVEDPGGDAAHYALICHPHPSYGGTMDNKVVTTVARALHSLGIPTLRFNFRGVGRSDGSFDQGIGETSDAAAAAAWAAERWPNGGLLLAGFSFGGYVALRLAHQIPVAQLLAIAPAVLRFDPALTAPPCATTIIQGDADEVVDPAAVIAWAAALSPPARMVVLPGVGHFFHGCLHDLRDAVIGTIRTAETR